MDCLTRSVFRRVVGLALAIGLTAVVAARPAATATAAPADPGPVGGIEVGSKGVKPIVLVFKATPDGTDYDIASAADKELKEANTDLGNPKDGGREFDPDRFDQTVKAVARFHQRLTGEHKLPADRTHVVVSSGVFSGLAPDAVEPARAKLAAAIKAATGREPGFVDATKETEYAARGTIPPAARGTALLIDIGSGNVRVGGYRPDGFKAVAVEYGTGRFQREVAKQAEAARRPFAEVAAEMREPLLGKPFREKLAAAGILADRTEVHMVGGASWALSTFTQPGKVRDTRVPVGAGDVARFAALARLAPVDARKAVLDAVPDAAAQAPAATEVDRVQKVFTPDQLVAGGEILQALAAECKLGDKKVMFFRKGPSAWIAGYLAGAAGLKD